MSLVLPRRRLWLPPFLQKLQWANGKMLFAPGLAFDPNCCCAPPCIACDCSCVKAADLTNLTANVNLQLALKPAGIDFYVGPVAMVYMGACTWEGAFTMQGSGNPNVLTIIPDFLGGTNFGNAACTWFAFTEGCEDGPHASKPTSLMDTSPVGGIWTPLPVAGNDSGCFTIGTSLNFSVTNP